MFTICRWVIIMNKGNYGSQWVMLGSVCGIVLMKEFICYQKNLRKFEKMDISIYSYNIFWSNITNSLLCQSWVYLLMHKIFILKSNESSKRTKIILSMLKVCWSVAWRKIWSALKYFLHIDVHTSTSDA